MSNFKIPAPPYRAIAFFSCSAFQHNGWTESIWISDPAAVSLQTARDLAITWAAKRLALSLPDVSIGRLRVSNTGALIKRSRVLADLGSDNVGTYTGTGSPETLMPEGKLKLRYQTITDPAHGVSDFLGGVPNNVITNTGAYAPDGEFTTAMTAYINFMKASCSIVDQMFTPSTPTAYPISDVQVWGFLAKHNVGRDFKSHRAVGVRG